jgi:arabinose-5-phosphate isomerase
MASRSRSTVARGREVLRIESEAVRALQPRINAGFTRAVALLTGCRGRVIVTGMGKAGIIGQKLSATLASTGTPSYWLHPAEAIHGDMGRITSQECHRRRSPARHAGHRPHRKA